MQENDVLQEMFKEVIKEYRLAPNRIGFRINRNRKGSEVSRTVCIYEVVYPLYSSFPNNVVKTTPVVTLINNKKNVVRLKKQQFDAVGTPADRSLYNVVRKGEFVDVVFNDLIECDNSYTEYIRKNIYYCIENYETDETFDCCAEYLECSKKRECVHENLLYARRCVYRKHQESGRVFYV